MFTMTIASVGSRASVSEQWQHNPQPQTSRVGHFVSKREQLSLQKAQQQHMTSVQKCVQTADSISLDQHLLSSRQVNWRDLMEMYVGCAHCMLQINAFVEFSKVSW